MYIKIKNIDVFYKSYINNKSLWNVLILHWWWWSSDSWAEVWKWISKKWYNVYIPDLPWFWKTKLWEVYSVEKYAELIKLFSIELKLKDINLIWHSNWWRIWIFLSSNKLVSVRKLFLIASAWIRRKSWAKRKILSFLSKILKPIIRNNFIKNTLYRLIWWHDYMNCNNENLKKTMINVLETELQNEMKNIKIHTEIIWWDKDSYTPLIDWKLIHSLIKWSNMTVLKWEKHWIHLQNPELLKKTIIKLIWT